MMPPCTVLIVSNGEGEDRVAVEVARALEPDIRVVGVPLVGSGEAYGDLPLLGPRLILPSAGFGLRGNWLGLIADMRTGAISRWRQQRKALRQERGRHAAVVAIGDTYSLWMASLSAARTIFVATAKSEFNDRHRLPELWLMRRRARMVLARDQATAGALSARGIPARYVGNPLMDALPAPRARLPFSPEALALLLLPGSRADASRNLLQLLKACARIHAKAGTTFVCALAPAVRTVEVIRAAGASGWEPDGEYLRRGEVRVLLTRDFGAAVRTAAVTIGVGGTANEQAAGMGVPVVAFPPPEALQFTPRFLALQQRLLGDALISTRTWEEAADVATRLLADPAERQRRGQAGRERMGGPGAVRHIAEEIRGAISAPLPQLQG